MGSQPFPLFIMKVKSMSRRNINGRFKRGRAERLRQTALKREAARQAQEAAQTADALQERIDTMKRETLREKQRLVEAATGESWYYHIEEDGTLLSKKIKELWPEEALAQREGRPSPRFSVKGNKS